MWQVQATSLLTLFINTRNIDDEINEFYFRLLLVHTLIHMMQFLLQPFFTVVSEHCLVYGRL
jgi:hypothetical protein